MSDEELRILVVDDEEAVRDVIARILRQRRYKVETAGDAAEALTSHRSYRAARTKQEASAIMEEETGRTFDPNITRVFFSLLVDGSVEDASLRVPVT
jgi:response regulator RpfG family c-di-GMP phosphodiesterase